VTERAPAARRAGRRGCEVVARRAACVAGGDRSVTRGSELQEMEWRRATPVATCGVSGDGSSSVEAAPGRGRRTWVRGLGWHGARG